MDSKETLKAKYQAVQQSLFNGGDLAPIAHFDSRRYIQHNPLIPDGLDAILGFIDGMRPAPVGVRVCRIFGDGAYTFVHNDYRLGTWGSVIAFDLVRWENGRIVEHWDNIQPTPNSPNPSGRSMTDGADEVVDLAHTEENKLVASKFTQEILIAGGRDLKRFFNGNALIQHSPAYGDGVETFAKYLEKTAVVYTRLHKVLGEGNFVLTTSEGWTHLDGKQILTGIYDLYRLDSGMIAEHWEVVEAVPSRDQWVNENGKF